MHNHWVELIHLLKETVLWLHYIDNEGVGETLAKVEREIESIQEDLRDVCEHYNGRHFNFDGIFRCDDCAMILEPTVEDKRLNRK